MSSSGTLTVKSRSKFSEVNKYTIPLSGSLALRVYSDTKPHNWKIADLQKGLILVYKGTEVIGEGTGFGVPILLYADETYFSGSSNVYLCRRNNPKIIRKEFSMDTVSRKTIGKVILENRKLSVISRFMAELYQKHRHLRPIISTRLYNTIGVHGLFLAKTIPKGKVVVTYGKSRDRISVKVDFSLLLKRNLQRIAILNEQSSRFFRRYSDSKGTKLIDEKIGSWETVEAEWASITDLQGRVGFRLRKTKNAVLRRGQEFRKGFLDWIGLDYEISPKNDIFEYGIEIFGV